MSTSLKRVFLGRIVSKRLRYDPCLIHIKQNKNQGITFGHPIRWGKKTFSKQRTLKCWNILRALILIFCGWKWKKMSPPLTIQLINHQEKGRYFYRHLEIPGCWKKPQTVLCLKAALHFSTNARKYPLKVSYTLTNWIWPGKAKRQTAFVKQPQVLHRQKNISSFLSRINWICVTLSLRSILTLILKERVEETSQH